MPNGSIWRSGLKLTRPRSQAVLSPSAIRHEAVRRLVEGDGDHERQDPDRKGVGSDIHGMSSMWGAWARLNTTMVWSDRFTARALGLRIARQAVVEPDPVQLFRDPHMRGRRKGIAVVESRERNAGPALPTLRQANSRVPQRRAEHAVELVGGGIARGLALELSVRPASNSARAKNGEPIAFWQLRHPQMRTLTGSPSGLEANRAAQASAFSGHDIPG